MDKKISNPTGWNELPYDLLVKIFMLLNISDLVTGVSRICSSWRTACHDPSLWKKVDMNSLEKSNLIDNPGSPNSMSNELKTKSRLMIVLNIALNLSRGQITCLIFPFCLFLNDEELISVARRSPNLKRLVLQSSFQFNVEAFQAAAKYWKDLESLTIPYVFRYEEILSCIGANCKNLFEMKSSCSIDLGFAEAIVANVPRLKVLSLRQTAAFKQALLHLLKGLKNLEVLNLTHVLVADLTPAGLELQGIDEEITKCALGLKKFLTCTERQCPMCNVVENDIILRSYELDEEDWRWDEVPSLTI